MSTDQSVIGKYKLLSCLASGQHSQVWEAIDNETTRRVAMKLLLPEMLKDPEQVAAIKHEFKVGSSLEHPNIIKYHEVKANKEHAYFTMELFPSPNLKAQIYGDLRGVHMRLKRIVELAAMALEHVHEKGWLHRDIKPDNILVNKSAEVRIIDFSLASRPAGGLSKMLGKKTQTIQGTRTYMAPEQILGKPLTIQTDIYNFGITLFEMLTGQPPFKGSTPKDLLLRHLNEHAPAPSEYNNNITPEMDAIILRMLSKKAEQRQRKMAEFIVEFRNVTVFKEAIAEKVELTDQEKLKQAEEAMLGVRLDSRTDALRTKVGAPAPLKPAKPKPVVARKPAAPPAPPPMRPGALPATPMGPAAVQGMPMPPGMMPAMPMPGMPPMPGYGMPQYPQAPAAWMAPMPGAMPGAPWVNQPIPQAGQFPVAPAPMPVPAPAAVPQPIAAPQPVAKPVVPPVAPPAPVAARPAQPVAPVPAPKPPPAKKPKPAAPAKAGEGFNIGDLPGFDELPPVS